MFKRLFEYIEWKWLRHKQIQICKRNHKKKGATYDR
jgi:hypothetical protein